MFKIYFSCKNLPLIIIRICRQMKIIEQKPESLEKSCENANLFKSCDWGEGKGRCDLSQFYLSTH